MSAARFPVVVLISGRGTNLQTIVDEVRAGKLPIDIRAVISNNPEAAGLKQAHAAGLHIEVVDHRAHPTRADFDQALIAAIDAHAPKLVALAGFMRILGRDFIEHYRGRLINIHPSLLPKYPGLGTHARHRRGRDTARRERALCHSRRGCRTGYSSSLGAGVAGRYD